MTHSGKFVTPRRPEEVYTFLANPELFAPLLPDFESMTLEDATHFRVRIGIAMAKVNGHIELAMNLSEAVPASQIGYQGHGTVAGSQLVFDMQFGVVSAEEVTEVCWNGKVDLDGPLAFIAGSMIETLGGRNFELIADRLRQALSEALVALSNEIGRSEDPEVPSH